MSLKRKLLVVLLVLAVGFTAFASEGSWNVYGGTSYMITHVGASYSLGQFEFGGNLYSAFPNVGLISYITDSKEYDPASGNEKPNLFKYWGNSFQLGYAGTVSASYDVIKSKNVDFDLGLSIAGMYTELFEGLGLKGGVVSADATMKFQCNFGEHSGIYVATEIPLAGVLLLNQTVKNDDGTTEVTNTAHFFTFTLDGYLSAVVMLMAYTSRIGYIYRF